MKTSVLESLFNKFSGLQAGKYYKDIATQVCCCEYFGTFKNIYIKGHLRKTSSDLY